MRFSIAVDGPSRGYVLEVFDNHFCLPNLGVIGNIYLVDPYFSLLIFSFLGANGLANHRDFETPTGNKDLKKFISFSFLNAAFSMVRRSRC